MEIFGSISVWVCSLSVHSRAAFWMRLLGFVSAVLPALHWWPTVQFSSVAQSRPTLCDPMDCSPPGCSVHGIFQARVLQWVVIPFSKAYTLRKQIETDTYIPLFSAALFTIARTWKQPRCSSTDEWIKKQWYMNTMEYYSAIKRNTFESVLMW